MKFLLTLVLLTVPYQNWSRGNIYQDRVMKLIDCQIRGELPQCEAEVKREGMSNRDLKLALEDVRNAVQPRSIK